MRKFIILAVAAGALAACSQSGEEAAVKEGANEAQPRKPAHCFFKDDELKGFAASRDKDGNIAVKGKAHVKDPRYKAQFGPAETNGSKAVLAPTIGQNDGYAAPDDTWDISATIPNSAAVTSVEVQCGGKTVAALEVPAKP